MQDSIRVEEKDGTFSCTFYQNNNELNPMSMFGVLEKHPEAEAYANSARLYTYASVGTSAVGGFLIGYPIGSALAGGDFNTPMFASGVGAILVSFTLGVVANSKLSNAVSEFNQTLPNTSFNYNFEQNKIELSLQF